MDVKELKVGDKIVLKSWEELDKEGYVLRGPNWEARGISGTYLGITRAVYETILQHSKVGNVKIKDFIKTTEDDEEPNIKKASEKKEKDKNIGIVIKPKNVIKFIYIEFPLIQVNANYSVASLAVGLSAFDKVYGEDSA